MRRATVERLPDGRLRLRIEESAGKKYDAYVKAKQASDAAERRMAE